MAIHIGEQFIRICIHARAWGEVDPRNNSFQLSHSESNHAKYYYWVARWLWPGKIYKMKSMNTDLKYAANEPPM